MRPSFLALSGSSVMAVAAAFAGTARADDLAPGPTTPRSHAYALIVGSNIGGAGQPSLQFAEQDAEQIAEVLREIGHFEPSDVHVLLHPTAAQVLAAIDQAGAYARDRAAHGEQTQVVFYYSGHAQATALNLGTGKLALTTLRERLGGLPTALTLVLLDACQSGAFARVKGAEPAADFSYNSVSKLTQKGLAIMASSTAEELSQESDELRGSYFTHHLLTALRGAGDADGDGRVSLDEAYRYAYRRTLASTARTQVGEQHVTLETDLAGQGDVPVTYPADAKAQLELPAPLDARVLLQRVPSGSVVAEVEKAPGTAMRLAFVAGSYEAVVARRAGVVQCRFVLADDQVAPFDTSSCAPVAPDTAHAKGEASGSPVRETDRWSVEASAGVITRQNDAFTNRLQTFGYDQQRFGLPVPCFAVGAARILVPHLAGVLQVATLSSSAALDWGSV